METSSKARRMMLGGDTSSRLAGTTSTNESVKRRAETGRIELYGLPKRVAKRVPNTEIDDERDERRCEGQ